MKQHTPSPIPTVASHSQIMIWLQLMTGGWQPHKGEEKPSHVAFSPPRPAKPESVRLAAERKDWTPSPAAPAAPAVPQRR